MDPGSGDELPPTQHFWPDPTYGPWKLGFRWRVVRGRAECVEAVMTSLVSPRGGTPTPRPLTAAAWRDVRIGRLLEEDRAGMAQLLPDEAAIYTRPTNMRPETFARLEEVARVYRGAINSGRPTKAVAAHFTLTTSAAAKLVSRARDAELLPRTGQRGVAIAGGAES